MNLAWGDGGQEGRHLAKKRVTGLGTTRDSRVPLLFINGDFQGGVAQINALYDSGALNSMSAGFYSSGF